VPIPLLDTYLLAKNLSALQVSVLQNGKIPSYPFHIFFHFKKISYVKYRTISYTHMKTHICDHAAGQFFSPWTGPERTRQMEPILRAKIKIFFKSENFKECFEKNWGGCHHLLLVYDA
jgi:hypothetical protein